MRSKIADGDANIQDLDQTLIMGLNCFLRQIVPAFTILLNFYPN